METEIADMVGMIRTALSSDPQDVEAVVSMVNEIIKTARNTLGISNSTIWERLTAIERAAYIRALNPQSKPEAEL
jgi:ribosome-binding protein aMBF1 (putative translation factor)